MRIKTTEWWIPPEKRTPQKKKRKPYHKGVKEYLASFQVGESRVQDEELRYGSLRATASRLFRDYGCKFTFKCVNGVRMVKRIL